MSGPRGNNAEREDGCVFCGPFIIKDTLENVAILRKLIATNYAFVVTIPA